MESKGPRVFFRGSFVSQPNPQGCEKNLSNHHLDPKEPAPLSAVSHNIMGVLHVILLMEEIRLTN